MNKRDLFRNIGIGLIGSAISGFNILNQTQPKHFYNDTICQKVPDNVLRTYLGEDVYKDYKGLWGGANYTQMYMEKRFVAAMFQSQNMNEVLQKASQIIKDHHGKYGLSALESNTCIWYSPSKRIYSCHVSFFTQKPMESNVVLTPIRRKFR
jgi:hypothetical protein